MSNNRKVVKREANSMGLYLPSLIAVMVTFWFQTKTQDPFNLTKFSFLLVFTPISLYFILINFRLKSFSRQAKLFLLVLGFFLVVFLSSAVSAENTYQSMVGMYQRNLGFLTYLCFALLLLSTSFAIKLGNVHKLILIFIATGAIETIYGVIQYIGADPVNWKNPYSPILGTFGNPNFQSAFLGVTSAAALGVALKTNWAIRAILSIQIFGSLFLIQFSNSSQGFMSFGVAASIIFVSYIRLNYRRFLIPSASLVIAVFGIAILGILNKGPAHFLYQASISARGDYWRAAISMLKSNPLMGVGIERFGDYFGNFRDLQQVRGRSFATFSDNAHNVFLHFAATGGIFLALTYLLLITLVIVFGVKKLSQCGSEQAHSISIVLGVFSAFIAISLISPENVGFTIWSWIFGGGLIGLSLFAEDNSGEKVKLSVTSGVAKLAYVTLMLFLIAPATILVQKMNMADRGIWNAYSIAYSGTGTLDDLLAKIRKVTETAPSEQRYKLLASSMAIGLDQPVLSRKYADEVLMLNSQSMDAYKIIAISFEKESKLKDAIRARKKMLTLDPYNLENLDKLARIEFEIGNIEKSKSYLGEMIKIQRENSLVTSLAEFLKS